MKWWHRTTHYADKCKLYLCLRRDRSKCYQILRDELRWRREDAAKSN